MNRTILVCSLLVILTVENILTKPVVPDKKDDEKKATDEEELIFPGLGVEFSRYLKQVVQAVEGDDALRKRLEQVTEEELNNGKFSSYLEEAHVDTRDKLDEIKRIEIERVKNAIKAGKFGHRDAKHLDIKNPFRFEVDDMQHLLKIVKDHTDAAEKQEQHNFKKYEMEQKLKHEIEMKKMNETARKKTEEEDKKNKEAIKEEIKHIKHPGSKHQLEDVWKNQDLDPRDMDPKVLYQLLDMNNDGFLERDELRAMLVPIVHDLKHLNGKEKEHELNRLEAHYMKQYDADGNNVIDRKEWDDMGHDPEYDRDDGWDIDEDPYSDDEYETYRKDHMGNFEDLYPHEDQNHIPQQEHYNPGQVPQQQQQYHPNQVEQQNKVPQYQQQQQPNPQQQYQQQQPNQQQQYQQQHQPNQQQLHPDQVKQQQQLHPNQVKQQQQPNQLPQAGQAKNQQFEHIPQQNNQVPVQNQGHKTVQS